MSEYTEEERKELIEKLAEAEQAKANTVEELQNLRKSKQTIEEEKAALQEELDKKKEVPENPAPAETDPEEVVERVLAKKAEQTAQQNREQALAEFKKANKEFAEDVDAGGIVFQKFQNELNKFNLNGLETKEQFLERFEEVKQYMNRSNPTDVEKPTFYKGEQPSGSEPAVEGGDSLTAKELKLIQDWNMDKESYLKMKAKRPRYIATLLSYQQ